mmetsp:Transcript_21615/g.69044  ORF Transcript_21615/g.69044 Transcript_21615/m.69044 type:complete len:225 (+) Transcript_21615:29-703(+)
MVPSSSRIATTRACRRRACPTPAPRGPSRGRRATPTGGCCTPWWLEATRRTTTSSMAATATSCSSTTCAPSSTARRFARSTSVRRRSSSDAGSLPGGTSTRRSRTSTPAGPESCSTRTRYGFSARASTRREARRLARPALPSRRRTRTWPWRCACRRSASLRARRGIASAGSGSTPFGRLITMRCGASTSLPTIGTASRRSTCPLAWTAARRAASRFTTYGART